MSDDNLYIDRGKEFGDLSRFTLFIKDVADGVALHFDKSDQIMDGLKRYFKKQRHLRRYRRMMNRRNAKLNNKGKI